MAKHAKTQDVEQARQQSAEKAEQGGREKRKKSKKEIQEERRRQIGKNAIQVFVGMEVMSAFFSLLFWNPVAGALFGIFLIGCWEAWKKHKERLIQAVKQAFEEEFSTETPSTEGAPARNGKAAAPVEKTFSPGAPQNAVFEVSTVRWDAECLFVDDALTELGVPHGKKVNGGVARFEIDPRNVQAAMSMLAGMEENVPYFTERRVRFGQGFNVSAQEIEDLARKTPAHAAPDGSKATPSCSSNAAPAA